MISLHFKPPPIAKWETVQALAAALDAMGYQRATFRPTSGTLAETEVELDAMQLATIVANILMPPTMLGPKRSSIVQP